MKELNYQIVRSPKRKMLTITVERDRTVVVHAPEGTPEQEVHRVEDEKRQWILAKLRHPQKYKERRHPPGKEVVNGESAPYLGRDYRIEVTETESGEIEFFRHFLVPPAHQAKLRDWYSGQQKRKSSPAPHNTTRELGVGFTSARIVDNRYRWGSCTVGDSVNFDWRLIKAPMFVIDYVIVHELAHLIEANHASDFWSIVRAKTPTMEKAKAWLKEHGQILEEEV